MVVYILLQTICVTNVLGGEVVFDSITRGKSGTVLSLFYNINFTPPPIFELNDPQKKTGAETKN